MFNFFKSIHYLIKAKKGIQDTGGFISDLSFGPIEGVFFLSFLILGVLVFGLGFVAFYFSNGVALFFSIIFLLLLIIDILIFKRIKSFFKTISRKTVSSIKQKHRSIESQTIIDVDYE